VSTAAAPAPLTTTASDPVHALDRAVSGRSHFLLRRLHSLTGIVFGGYLVVHLLINAAIAQGGNVYQTQVDKIHDLPFLPVIEWTFIYLPILFHTAYGCGSPSPGQPNVNRYSYGKNWFYSSSGPARSSSYSSCCSTCCH
jgi:succinate dehydrogenase / fumarate reductase cytochrome b subunit